MRRTVSLSGAVFALLCLAMILFALPAGAQDDGGIPPGTRATVSESDEDSRPIVIVVAANGCTVSQDASITLEVDDGQDVFANGGGTTISAPNGRPRIEVPPGREASFETAGDFLVVTSTGVSCEGGNAAQGQYADDDGEVDEAEDVIVGTTSTKKIPNTGGPPLLLFGALLMGAAVIAGRRVLRP